MHLFAAIDHESLRRSHRLVGADRDRHGEPLLQAAQMRALLIEQIEGNVGAGARDQIMRGAFDELLFECSQHLQSQRRHRADMTAAAAIGAFLGRAFQHTGADALPRHFEQAEMRDAADLDAGTIVFEAFLQPPLHHAVVALLIHVDEIDDDEPSKIAQAQLP